MRAIEYNPEGVLEAVVFRSVSIATISVEPAGYAFGKMVRRIRKLSEHKLHETVEEEQADTKGADNERIKKSKLKCYKDLDYYELYEYKERSEVNEENLKQKYKKFALLFHPDKGRKSQPSEDEKQLWLKV